MAAADKRGELIHVRGEGGAHLMLRRPLAPGIEDRLATGSLVRINRDGTPWTGEPEPLADSVAVRRAEREKQETVEQEQLAETPAERPAKSDPKGDWVTYATRTGGITTSAAKELTKDELIARYGSGDGDGDGSDTEEA